jgi:hypothetical protein
MNRIVKILLAGTALSLLVDHACAQVSNGLIYACVNNGSGTIHIVGQGAACQSNEISLVWNAVGPQGPARPVGPARRRELPDHKARLARPVWRDRPEHPEQALALH